MIIPLILKLENFLWKQLKLFKNLFFQKANFVKKLAVNVLVIICIFLNSCTSTNHIKSVNVKLAFYTSYNQFYVTDKDSDGNTSTNFWTQEAHDSHLAVSNGIIGVSMESYANARCQIKILKSKPIILDFNKYDHIVEAGLQINSGILQILNCPNSNVEFESDLPVGNYRVRVSSKGLTGISSDVSNLDKDDSYVIEIWPDNSLKKQVLKQSHF
jgi:hypothetical protein